MPPDAGSSPLKTLAERHIVVATHGHCLDGLCSAAMYTRLMRHVYAGQALKFTYHGAGYGPGQNGVDTNLLRGDENAILDFRFSASPKLTWYFDHHVSAFVTPDEKRVYEEHATPADAPGRQMFHDGTYSSCTKLIADIGERRFGLDSSPMRDIIHWADMIDSAAFPNPQMPVEKLQPELQVMTVVESFCDDAFLTNYVPRVLSETLGAIAGSDDIQAAFAPLREQHAQFVTLVRGNSVVMGPVVLVDLLAVMNEVGGKFVTYALYPQSVYSVIITRSKSKCKISIGYNPWSHVERRHNIAAICERYGGGGHPVVGSIALPADQVDRAREIANDVVRELMA